MVKLTLEKKKSLSKYGNRFFRWGMELVKVLFPVFLITYLLSILLDTLFEGSVSSYLNLNHLLIAVVIVGVAAVLTVPGKVERIEGERLTAKTILVIICAGVGGAAIIWFKTKEIGWLSYVISIVSGGLIVLLSMLIWQGDEGTEQKSDRRAIIEAEEVMKRAIREAEDTFKRAKREAKKAMERAIKEAKDRNEGENSQGS